MGKHVGKRNRLIKSISTEGNLAGPPRTSVEHVLQTPTVSRTSGVIIEYKMLQKWCVQWKNYGNPKTGVTSQEEGREILLRSNSTISHYYMPNIVPIVPFRQFLETSSSVECNTESNPGGKNHTCKIMEAGSLGGRRYWVNRNGITRSFPCQIRRLPWPRSHVSWKCVLERIIWQIVVNGS